jgi:NAD(P)-dependent dehydrogenase (short-subunit alcohol dehydrogenase family)
MSAPLKAADIFNLSGRVALVTGASSGLGTRFARVLAANGAKVVLFARRAERLSSVVDEIRAGGGQALAVAGDVTSTDDMRRAFDEAEAAFGTVTILCNNAGITHADRSHEMGVETWRNVMGVNLDAVLFWSQEAARRMLAKGARGAIINTASVLGFGVAKGVTAYNVSKAAVVQLTKQMGLELAFKGIRVNAIAPGWFVTEINEEYLSGKGKDMVRGIPAGRFGAEGDLDGALLLLASNAGAFMAGETVVVDGGQLTAIAGAH